LRAILEEVLLNTMYELPSLEDVGECLITAEVVEQRANPTLVRRTEVEKRKRSA
jgi:ATP-dependent Clp protease ATP-binding subunit ClpX